MGILGGVAYWGVQARKKNSMTLFDHRKQRYITLSSSDFIPYKSLLRLLCAKFNLIFEIPLLQAPGSRVDNEPLSSLFLLVAGKTV